MANRRKHANSIPVAFLSKWIVAAFFLGVAGLSYVYCKNQLHATANDIKSLERQREELDTQRDIVQRKISGLSSHRALQQWLNDGVIKMVPISDERIVRLNTEKPGGAGEYRPVANNGREK